MLNMCTLYLKTQPYLNAHTRGFSPYPCFELLVVPALADTLHALPYGMHICT